MQSYYYNDFFLIFLFSTVSFFLSLFLFFLTRALSTGTRLLDNEKLAAYECGFDPIDNGKQLIDLQFYRVAVIFIIFDIEVLFLLSWAVSLTSMNYYSILHSYYFLSVLLVGLYVEIKSNILSW